MSDLKENVTGAMPCKPFDMVDVWFRDGDLSSGFASDFYRKIDHDIADIIKYRVRENKTETPEEKEAFDSMSKGDSDNIHKPLWAKWSIGDEVTKIKGSSWSGNVVGYYSTSLTSKGYAVESLTEKGSVQIYPEAALRSIETQQQREERERREEAAEMIQCLLDNYSECEESAINYVLEFLHECDYRKAK